jgi:peroxin-6
VERSAILRHLLASKQLAPDVSIIDLARQTAAFVAGDLASLVIRTSYAAITRVMQVVYVYGTVFATGFHMADQTLSGDGVAPNDVFSAGLSLTNADFEIAMDEARSTYSQNIGAPKIPNVSWDDVGGLADVKADILDTVQLPLEHPELFASNLKKRSGKLVLRACVPHRDTSSHLWPHTHPHTQASCYTARQARGKRSSQRQ